MPRLITYPEQTFHKISLIVTTFPLNVQRSEGSECKVSDPLFSYEFNLTPLRKSDSNYKVPAGDYTYLLNVCGPLNSPPAECVAMGTCQTGSALSSPVAAGRWHWALFPVMLVVLGFMFIL